MLDASARLIADALVGLDDGTEWLLLSDAAAIAELSPVTLRGQLNKGRIAGEKRGRDWFITRHALDTYLDDVEQQRTGSFDEIVETATRPLKNVTSLQVPDRRFELTRSPRAGVRDELIPPHATRGGLYSMAKNARSSRPIVKLASKVIPGRPPTAKSAKSLTASVITQVAHKAKKKGK